MMVTFVSPFCVDLNACEAVWYLLHTSQVSTTRWWSLTLFNCADTTITSMCNTFCLHPDGCLCEVNYPTIQSNTFISADVCPGSLSGCAQTTIHTASRSLPYWTKALPGTMLLDYLSHQPATVLVLISSPPLCMCNITVYSQVLCCPVAKATNFTGRPSLDVTYHHLSMHV